MSNQSARRLISLSASSIEQVAQVISHAFHGSDELASTWTEELSHEVASGEVDTDLSLALMEGEEILGAVIVSPLPGGELRISRIGVMPSHRRLGLARDILQALIKRAQDQGFGQISLEVGADNLPAVAFWKAMGLEAVRTLIRLRGDRQFFQARKLTDELQVSPSSIERVLDDFDLFHGERPCWSRSRERLQSRSEGMLALELTSAAKRLGYLLVKGSRIEDIGLAPGDVRLASALVRKAFEASQSLALYAWPQDDPLVPELLSRGFTDLGSSLECRINLNRVGLSNPG